MFTQRLALAGTVVVLAVCCSAAPAQVAAPYFETFDTFTTCGTAYTTICPLSGGWTNITSDNHDWLPDAGGTPSLNTGPSDDLTGGGLYMYTETSGGGTGVFSIMTTPELDLNGLLNPTVKFWYHMFGAAMGNLHVDLYHQVNIGVGDVTNTTNLTAPTASFTPAHVGSLVTISGSMFPINNDGVYIITTYNSPTSVELSASFIPETGLTYTHTIATQDIIPQITDNLNVWQDASIPFSASLGTPGNTNTCLIVFRSERGNSFTSDMAIDNFEFVEGSLFDIELRSIDAPVAASCEPLSNVTITIRNLGAFTELNVPVSYQIDGGVTVTEFIPGPLTQGATIQYTFATPAPLAAGVHTIDIVASSAGGDQNVSNDVGQVMTNTGAVISTFPYVEDFESGPGGWASTGTNDTWAHGSPFKAIINSAASGLNVFTTGGLFGQYAINENSFLNGPCFDFTNNDNPHIEFNIWYDAEFLRDGLALESSTDGGITWQTVGALGSGDRWYTGTNINALLLNGTNGHGWSGTGTTGSGSYVTARQALTGLANLPLVQLRWHFASDQAIVDDGMAIDDISIFDVVVPFPGSNEDLVMKTATGGGTLSTGFSHWTKQVNAGALIEINTESPLGTFNSPNAQYLLAGDGYATGGAVPGAINPGVFPAVHLSNDAIVLTGSALTPVIPPGGVSMYYIAPAILIGQSFRLQGFAITPGANNGFFAVTDGHVLEIQ